MVTILHFIVVKWNYFDCPVNRLSVANFTSLLAKRNLSTQDLFINSEECRVK